MAELAAVATLLPTLTPQPAFSLTIPDRYLNIVLLGSDKRPGSGAWRTDSMIIVSVDTASNVVRLLSIPRDLWVYIPGHGYNRINTADLWGELAKKGSGPDRVKQTIHHNLGIPIHYYVRVDFQGFIQIIDTVGGIDVDVDCPLPDIKLSAGMHHMSGNEALRYARSRYSTNDFDRGRRQRKVLMALWDQALTLDIIPRLPQLWWTMANSFQTDLTLDQVINLAYVGVQLKPQRILSRAIGPRHVQSWITPQGAAVLLPNHQEIRAMLESFYAPVDTTRLDAADKVSVQLLNGSSRQDADQLAASTLRWAGFKVASAGPADRQDYAQTQIAVYSGDMTTAEQIAGELRISSAVIQDLAAVQGSGAPANPVEIQVILGRDYDPCQR
jgi:LCP family protein required for cell wall assembly